jgi:hypothetical protein
MRKGPNCAKRLHTYDRSLYCSPIIMTILTEFKQNVFRVLEGYMALAEFEQWLYQSKELPDLMGQDAVLEAFTFNYTLPDAKYRFKKAIFPYFDEDDFLLWKVKSNLRDLMASRDNRDRILHDFYYLGYDGYFFLQSIGSYMFEIDDIQYYGNNLQAVLSKLRQNAEDLLLEIEKLELEKPEFRLADYRPATTVNETSVITKRWWSFFR